LSFQDIYFYSKGIIMKKQFILATALSVLIVSAPLRSYGQMSSPLLSINEYNQIAMQHPNFAPVYFERGMARFGAKEYSTALQDLSKAIIMRPYDADAHYMRGATYLASGQLNQAISDLDKAAEQRKNMFVETFKMRGNLYLARAFSPGAINKLADAEAAIENFDEIVRLNPNCAEAHYNRGRGYFAKAYFTGASYEQAIVDFDKALSINPNFAAAKKERESAIYQQKQRASKINRK
jgi:tetratricopeptide (TPR) repeat protein